jgi:hypothetical protein
MYTFLYRLQAAYLSDDLINRNILVYMFLVFLSSVLSAVMRLLMLLSICFPIKHTHIGINYNDAGHEL